MKSLKYEGKVKIKIFRSLRRLEAGLSGFGLKRVHYGKFGLQIITNLPYYTNQTRPFLLHSLNLRTPPPSERKNASATPFPFIFLHFLYTHTLIHHPLRKKLPYFHSSSLLLYRLVRNASDLWLVVGKTGGAAFRRRWSCFRRTTAVSGMGALFCHFLEFSSYFNFISSFSFPFSCSSSATIKREVFSGDFRRRPEAVIPPFSSLNSVSFLTTL